MVKKLAAVIVLVVSMLIPWTVRAQQEGVIFIPFGNGRWEGSVDLDTFTPLDDPKQELWIDVQSKPDGSIELKRSDVCPDYYIWPAIRTSQALTIDLDKTPWLYYDITCDAVNSDGFWIYLYVADRYTIYLPPLMYEQAGELYAPTISDLGGSGHYKGRVNIKEYIAKNKPELANNDELLINTINITLRDNDYLTVLTINELYFGSDSDEFMPLMQPSQWAKESVTEAEQLALTTPEALHNVRADLRRGTCADLLTKLLTLCGETTPLPYESLFDDTESYNAFRVAHAQIMLGTGTRKFSPDSTVTREQWAVMLMRLLRGVPVRQTTPSKLYQDEIAISSWARNAVEFVTTCGLMQGDGESFMPKAAISCEQALKTMIHVYKNYKEGIDKNEK